MKRFSDLSFFMVLLLGAILIGGPGHAASDILGNATDRLEIDANQGVLIRLDRAASTVFVANPDIADIQVKSPRLIYVLGKAPGETTLYAADAQERVLANRTITVSHNLSRLRRELAALLPTANLNMSTIGSRLVVSGSVSSPREADEVRRFAEGVAGEPKNVVLNLGVTAPAQVHLRVRVAEVSRNVLKQFGINWDNLFNPGNFLFGFVQGRNFLNTARNTFDVTGTSTNVIGRYRSSVVDINGLIDALDDNRLISVLAEPNLTAVSGKPASFLAGGEFPIVVPDDRDRIAIEFKQFGVQLVFTPTVLGNDRISLFVNPEVSQLSDAGAVTFGGFNIPALTTRRAETTVELGNGQSFAIGGLLQNNMRNSIDKFPGLGDVPVLGTLFRSTEFRRNESELVIIVTPYLVRPISNGQMALPTDGMVPPTDTDRILHGRIYRPTARRDVPAPIAGAKAETRQPLGFILE